MPKEIEQLTVRVTEAIRISGISRSELYRRLAKGEIEAVKIGKSILINVASLRAFVANLPCAEFAPPPRKP